MGKTYRKEEYNERRVGEKKEPVFYILEEEPRILGGESANAVSHYHKLCSRVSHIWGNRRGQPNLSAMERPHPGGTALMITVHYVKNGPKLRHDISTSMSKISMLRALDVPKTLYRFHPHISRL